MEENGLARCFSFVYFHIVTNLCSGKVLETSKVKTHIQLRQKNATMFEILNLTRPSTESTEITGQI